MQETQGWWVARHAQRVRVPLWVQGLECVEVLSVGLWEAGKPTESTAGAGMLQASCVVPPAPSTDKSFSENCLKEPISYYWTSSTEGYVWSWEESDWYSAHSCWHLGVTASTAELAFAHCWAKPEVENGGAPSLHLWSHRRASHWQNVTQV